MQAAFVSTRRLASLAIAGVAAYVAVDAALAVLRPDISLLADAESDYGRGAFSWLMDLNFLLRGGLTLALVGALGMAWPAGRSRWALWALAAWGVGSGLLALFPDAPDTPSGRIHVALAGVAFLAAVVGAIGVAAAVRGWPGWRRGGDVLGVIGVVAIGPLLLTARTLGRADSRDGGLFERLFLSLILAWILVAAVLVRGRGSAMAGHSASARAHAG